MKWEENSDTKLNKCRFLNLTHLVKLSGCYLGTICVDADYEKFDPFKNGFVTF